MHPHLARGHLGQADGQLVQGNVDGGPRRDIVQAWWARRAGHTARILAMTAR